MEEVSKPARAILQAFKQLATEGQETPTHQAVYLLAAEAGTAERQEIKERIDYARNHTDKTGLGSVLARVHDRQFMVALSNQLMGMLGSGEFEASKLAEELGTYNREQNGASLVPVSESLKDGIPSAPSGIPLKGLPRLTQVCGGIYGVWVLGGMPKVGKSTLAWFMSLDASQIMPVLYYDMENGLPTLLHRTAEMFKGDLEKMRRLTTNVYHRSYVKSLGRDLSHIPAPALVVIDSIQKLPTGNAKGEDDRTRLDKWLHRFESLKKQGYHVLLISEINRANYGAEPNMGGFKASGEIEYTADCGMHLTTTGNHALVHVVAHRHRPVHGHIDTLVRVNNWGFKEVDLYGRDESDGSLPGRSESSDVPGADAPRVSDRTAEQRGSLVESVRDL